MKTLLYTSKSENPILKIRPIQARESGIALLMVMIICFALMVVAGVFAYSIKIETKLANNTRFESDMEWLGRSGVEMARWILAQERKIPRQAGVDALSQFWAGGPGQIEDIDNPFAGMSLRGIQCGPGRFSLQIFDEERKININSAAISGDFPLFERALTFVGVNPSDGQLIFNCVRDWIEPGEKPRAGGGAKSEYYLTLDPPYRCKNGPIEDITELIRIRGIGPELVGIGDAQPLAMTQSPSQSKGPGLEQFFCAISSGQLNVNTASSTVLQIKLGIPAELAQRIIEVRSGPDRAEGTFDDTPFRNAAEAIALIANPGQPPVAQSQLITQSQHFRVLVEAEMGTLRQRYVALVRRGIGRELQQPAVLFFHRE